MIVLSQWCGEISGLSIQYLLLSIGSPSVGEVEFVPNAEAAGRGAVGADFDEVGDESHAAVGQADVDAAGVHAPRACCQSGPLPLQHDMPN